MTYREFEELPVWQAAIELGVRVFRFTKSEALRGHSGLRDQLERAVLSISNNIAEGFERGTHEELITFLFYERGSAGETRSMFHLLERLSDGAEWSSEVVALRSQSKSISRQLGGWLDSLNRSDALGPRNRNEVTRQRSENLRRGDSFLQELRRIQEDARTKTENKPQSRDQGNEG